MPLAADEAPTGSQTPFAGKALHLFTPTSGDLFAQVDNDLYRSDDAARRGACLTAHLAYLLPIRCRHPLRSDGSYKVDQRMTLCCMRVARMACTGATAVVSAGIWFLPTAGRVWHPDFPSSGGVKTLLISPSVQPIRGSYSSAYERRRTVPVPAKPGQRRNLGAT